MGRWRWKGLLVGGLLAGWAAPALAAEAEAEASEDKAASREDGKSKSGGAVVREPDKLKVRDKTRVDFNDSTVDGRLIRPDGSYIPGTKRAQFDSLIQMRSHFYDELKKSSQDL